MNFVVTPRQWGSLERGGGVTCSVREDNRDIRKPKVKGGSGALLRNCIKI